MSYDLGLYHDRKLSNKCVCCCEYCLLVNADSGFFKTVKLDHLVWKASVYDAVLNGNTDQCHFAGHTTCRLGKWYYEGEGAQKYSGLSAFKALGSPHEAVHQAGFKALNAAKEGEMKDAQVFLSQMEDASDIVFKKIDSLAKEKK